MPQPVQCCYKSPYLGGDFSAKKILLFNGAILPNAWVLFSVVDFALQAAVFKLWPKILHLIARSLELDVGWPTSYVYI